MKKKKTFLQNNMIVDVQMWKTCFKDMAKPTIVVQDNMMIIIKIKDIDTTHF